MSNDNGNNYERQNMLALELPESVAVVGCGGVGSWVALFLAMSGVKELWLFDHDTLSDHNLNRVLFTREEVGREKAGQLRELIMRYRADCTVYACGMFTPEVADGVGLSDGLGYVVAATDSVASRVMIAKWAEDSGVNYLEVAAEGEIGSIAGSPADFVTPQETQAGYQSVPVWLGSAVSAAVMAVSYIVHGAVVGDAVLRAGWDGDSYVLYNSSQPLAPVVDNPYVSTNVTSIATEVLVTFQEESDEQEAQAAGGERQPATGDDLPF